MQAHMVKIMKREGEQFFAEMHPAPSQPNPAGRWWEVTLRLDMPVTAYRFLLFTPDGPWWYNGMGLKRHVPTEANDFRLLADYEAPVWVKSAYSRTPRITPWGSLFRKSPISK